jgi:aquaporin Z
MKKLMAEFIGTFMLVSAVCGAGALGLAGLPYGFVAMAVGISVMVMVFAVGHVSGGHFNPAVTIGLVVGGRHPASDAVGYVVAQVLGGTAAAIVWYLVAVGQLAPGNLGNFASNGFDAGSPGGYGVLSVLIAEIAATALFIFVIMGATSRNAPSGFAPIAIGLGLFVSVLITIPVSNGSINPARSTATAIVDLWLTGTAMKQIWIFWLAPIAGGVLGGILGKMVQDD